MLSFDDENESSFHKNKASKLQEDLQSLSLQELEDRIVRLESEIERARAVIAQKQRHRSGIESLFTNGD